MKRLMRQSMIAMAAILLVGVNTVKAQDSEITDKDLYNYALMMQVVEQMKAEVSPAIMALIDKQEGFDVNRYNELKTGAGDDAKLKELGANDFEVKFMGLIIGEKEKRESSIKEAVNLLAKSMVGVSNYKAVKAALSSDAEIKAKYDEIAKSIAPADSEA